MLMPILDDRRAAESNDNLLRTISTRIAGGRKDVTTEQPRVSSSIAHICCLTNMPPIGYRGPARVPLVSSLAVAYVRHSRRTCDIDCRRLCARTGHVCGAKEHTRFNVEFQQRQIVGPYPELNVHPLTLSRYTQCEMMSAHYKHPILLIEWEENKSFSFGVRYLT